MNNFFKNLFKIFLYFSLILQSSTILAKYLDKGEHTMKILSIYNKDEMEILCQQAKAISLTKEGLEEAKLIVEQLLNTLKPLMPAAGLAAPQIGISKRVFVYSWNRSDMEPVINPTIVHHGDELNTSWEACFSTIQKEGISKAALVTRSNAILVSYYDLDGKLVKKQLTGFAAKVFQHEYDHLEGIENTKKSGAQVEVFEDEHKLIEFMKSVKKTDGTNYKEPEVVN